jgi:hypothetical protein
LTSQAHCNYDHQLSTVNRGAQLAGRGPWHAGIAKCFKNEDFFAENCGNFWKKVVLRKISGTFVFEKITSTPLSPTFS